MTIPLQVGSELRMKKTGEIVVDNPETELAETRQAADAVFEHSYDPRTGEHVLRLLDPVADHNHLKRHRPGD